MNVAPSTAFTFYADLGTTGLEGTAGMTVYLDDDVSVARTTSGIEQIGTSTVYSIQLTSPPVNGGYSANVDDGTNNVWFETIVVSAALASLQAVEASAALVFYADLSATGLEGTAGVTVYLDDDVVTARTAAGIEQLASSTVYSVEITTPAADGYYAALVDDDGTNVVWFEPFTVGSDVLTGDAYASTEELFRILKIRAPSAEQQNAAERVLLAAATEIDDEIDLADDADALSAGHLALVAQVNLERAAELWELQEIHFGVVGLGSEFGATHIARNTWDKHAYTLANIKGSWGIA